MMVMLRAVWNWLVKQFTVLTALLLALTVFCAWTASNYSTTNQLLTSELESVNLHIDELEQSQKATKQLNEKLTKDLQNTKYRLSDMEKSLVAALEAKTELEQEVAIQKSKSQANSSTYTSENQNNGSNYTYEAVVYVNSSGYRYHRFSCRYVKSTSYTKFLSEAVRDGYSACLVCY